MLTADNDFRKLLGNATYWMDKAASLRASAGAVWYCLSGRSEEISSALGAEIPVDFSRGSWQVYRLLCGMSLELAYKAILVALQRPVPATHDLVHLAELAEIKLTKSESGVLELLHQCIVWEGRYPVPKNPAALEYFVYLHYENLFRPERKGNLTVLKPKEPDPLDWTEYNQLWEQAHAAFEWHSS